MLKAKGLRKSKVHGFCVEDSNGARLSPYFDKRDTALEWLKASFLREALQRDAHAFDNNDHVNGADLVEWFSEWRARVKAAFPCA